MADHKSMMLALMGGKKSMGQADGMSEEDDMDMGEGDEGIHMAAEDILHSVKSGDAKMLAEALKNFMDMCHSEPDGDEGGEMSEDY